MESSDSIGPYKFGTSRDIQAVAQVVEIKYVFYVQYL